MLLAASPLLEGIGGRYFADCNEAVHIKQGEHDMAGVVSYALDSEAARRLWEESLRLLGAQ